ncbi:MAG: hypothetical protein A4S14_05105 [Proteobacteria bacterium SG_bin9]|nr:MAG: hypothetical protein A4S14_05105 [Proteobacteria bacterium SG_bin9]
MKSALLVFFLAFASSAAVNVTPAAARDYSYCLVGTDFAGFGDCKFDTLAQCQASASGRDAGCAANPYPGYYDRSSANAQFNGKRR